MSLEEALLRWCQQQTRSGLRPVIGLNGPVGAGKSTLARSLQQPAPLDLRVNTLKAPRQAVLERLEADGTPAVATRYSPIGVRL
ncbi:MAG: hypothetical protein ACO3FK_06750, partial [Vulcanococcus sp.]